MPAAPSISRCPRAQHEIGVDAPQAFLAGLQQFPKAKWVLAESVRHRIRLGALI
jgi:hypothetical protein